MLRLKAVKKWSEAVRDRLGNKSEALLISLAYFFVSAFWILISDEAVKQFLEEITPETILRVQTIKGLSFITLSSLLLFYLLKRSFGKIYQQKAELEEGERAFSSFVNNLPGFFYRCKNDLDWTMVFINESSYLLTGYQVEEILHNEELSYNDLIHPDDQQRVYDEVQKALRSGRRFQVEYRILTKDGQMKWVWEQGLLAFKEDGEEYLEGYVTDVTDVQFLKQSIEEKNNYYKMLLDNANDGIYVLDVDPQNSEILGFKEMNKVAAERLGINRSKFMNINPNNIELIRKNVLSQIPEIFNNGSVTFETHFFDNQNQKRYAELSAHLFKANTESLVLAISRDITDRVRFKEKLKERNNELQTLLYKASHDLRSPVTNILGLVELGIQESNSKDSGYYGWVKKSAEQLLYVIESLGTASESIKDTLSVQEINLHQLLEEEKKHFNSLAGFENVTFHVEINESDKAFYNDKELMESILNNLIGNAFKFRAEEESPEISIKSKTVRWGLELEVSDNGVGIDQAAQDRVFEMFYRGHKHSKGSGLGLYIVKNALDKINGSITFDSIPGKGTTFKVFIPSQQ